MKTYGERCRLLAERLDRWDASMRVPVPTLEEALTIAQEGLELQREAIALTNETLESEVVPPLSQVALAGGMRAAIESVFAAHAARAEARRDTETTH